MNKMRKQFGIMLGMVMMLSALIGCGSSEPDPNSGLYEAQSAEMFGMSMDITDLFENGVTIELQDGGKAILNMNGEDGKMEWTLEGDKFHAEGGGAELDGTLSDGVLYLEDMLGMGVNMQLVCEDLANGSGASDGENKEKKPASGSVLDRLKDVQNGETVYPLDGGDEDDGGDSFGDDIWTEPEDVSEGGEVSEYAAARGLDASWFGEGIADAETLGGFYVWWADELTSGEKEEMYDRYLEVLEEHMGCKPMDANTDNDDLDRAEFRYETPEGDGSLLILMVREDGKWRPASISPGGTALHAVDAIRGE